MICNCSCYWFVLDELVIILFYLSTRQVFLFFSSLHYLFYLLFIFLVKQFWFTLLCHAVCEAALVLPLGAFIYGEKCLFINDWHAGLVPVYVILFPVTPYLRCLFICLIFSDVCWDQSLITWAVFCSLVNPVVDSKLVCLKKKESLSYSAHPRFFISNSLLSILLDL